MIHATLLLVIVVFSSVNTAIAAELLIIESDDCPYCKRFHAEIGVPYPNTEEGKTAPLRVIDINDQMPEEYSGVKHAFVTPTFILVKNGKEVDRLLGYPGDEFFWFLLGEMLDKL